MDGFLFVKLTVGIFLCRRMSELLYGLVIVGPKPKIDDIYCDHVIQTGSFFTHRHNKTTAPKPKILKYILLYLLWLAIFFWVQQTWWFFEFWVESGPINSSILCLKSLKSIKVNRLWHKLAHFRLLSRKKIELNQKWIKMQPEFQVFQGLKKSGLENRGVIFHTHKIRSERSHNKKG